MAIKKDVRKKGKKKSEKTNRLHARNEKRYRHLDSEKKKRKEK